jgi:hypothetical protein
MTRIKTFHGSELADEYISVRPRPKHDWRKPLIKDMKKLSALTFIALASATLLTGCVVALGSGTTTKPQNPTVGQQLIDLQKAKDAGAISDQEYQTQKAKLLSQ